MDKKLFQSIAKKYGTPTYIYDQNKIEKNYYSINSAFKNTYEGEFKILYPVKVNNNLAILKIMQQLGAGFDCSSPGEIYLANKTNSKFNIHTGNYCSKKDLQNALENNMILNLDDASDLEKLSEIPETLFFRLNPANNYQGTFKLSGEKSKFGINEGKIISAYMRAKEKGVKKFGIHMMTASNVLDEEYFMKNTETLLKTISKLHKNNIYLDYIDLGGGFGLDYKRQKTLDINLVAKLISNEINAFYNQSSVKKPTLIIEPGRFLIGNAGYLLAKVQNIKREEDITFVGIDASINSIPRIALFNSEHDVEIITGSKTTKKVTLCGQICWGGDILKKDFNLKTPSIGELVIIKDAGAYGFCHSNNFNTREKPAEVLINGEKTYLIRTRETLDDFVKGVKIPEHLI